MSTPYYTLEQISALRALRQRLGSAKYGWEVRQLLKDTATATGLDQIQLVEWQDEQNNRKNLLHWLVDEKEQKPALLLIQEIWSRKESDQRQLMRLLTHPKCYIDSPQGGSGEYTVERLAEGRNCEQLVDMIARFRELYRDISDPDPDPDPEAEEQEATAEERTRATQRTLHLKRISTPIPRTPSPPSVSAPLGTTPGLFSVLAPANFSPLHVAVPFCEKALARHQLVARQASSSSSLIKIASDPVDVDVEMIDSSSPIIQDPVLVRGGDGVNDQPSTPPPFVPSSPPPAPGASDSPVWYPPSEPEPEPELNRGPARRGLGWEKERKNAEGEGRSIGSDIPAAVGGCE